MKPNRNRNQNRTEKFDSGLNLETELKSNFQLGLVIFILTETENTHIRKCVST